jgi:limonene 1,2-monooxygenase
MTASASVQNPGLRFGAFLAPYHPLDESPTLAIQRDLELMEHLDQLGFAEAWVGEHHSAGYEIIASPELFIAAAAERTRRIRLGTGVISLPYHNPLMVADRILQLDHMTRGRAMFGVGPGLLPSDAQMLGVPVEALRDRMAQALDVILRLIAGETVDETTEWYTLKSARCQLRPYSHPRPEFAVASTFTPSGAKLAGKYDLAMLCVAATETRGYDALDVNWRIACDVARQHGRSMSLDAMRLVGPMHIAETREQALEDVAYGLQPWLDYFARVSPDAPASAPSGRTPAESLIASGRAVIGTPEDAIAQIRRLQEKTGAFGQFLLLAHNWASWERTKNSYALFARHVMPVLQEANAARVQSLDWYTEHRQDLTGRAVKAARDTLKQHQADVDKALRAKSEDGGSGAS